MNIIPTDDLIIEGPIRQLSLPAELGKRGQPDHLLGLAVADSRVMHLPAEPLLPGEVVQVRIRRVRPLPSRDVNEGRAT